MDQLLLAAIGERLQLLGAEMERLRQLRSGVLRQRGHEGLAHGVLGLADDALRLVAAFAGPGPGGAAGLFRSCQRLRAVPVARTVTVHRCPPSLDTNLSAAAALHDFGELTLLGMEHRWRSVTHAVLKRENCGFSALPRARVLLALLARVLPGVAHVEVCDVHSIDDLLERVPFAFPGLEELTVNRRDRTRGPAGMFGALNTQAVEWFELPPGLRALRVGQPPQLRALCGLEELVLWEQPAESVLPLLRLCPRLRRLELPQELDAEAWRALADGCPDLEALVTAVPGGAPGGLRRLTSLTVQRGLHRPALAALVAAAPPLERLVVEPPQPQQSGFSMMANPSPAEPELDDAAFAGLVAAFPRLHTLRLGPACVRGDERTVSSLAALPGLTELELGRLSDAGLAALPAACPRLRVLRAWLGRLATDTGLLALTRLTALDELHLLSAGATGDEELPTGVRGASLAELVDWGSSGGPLRRLHLQSLCCLDPGALAQAAAAAAGARPGGGGVRLTHEDCESAFRPGSGFGGAPWVHGPTPGSLFGAAAGPAGTLAPPLLPGPGPEPRKGRRR